MIGKIGENLAVDYLKKNNYKIIQRNFECKSGEIDIIAIDLNVSPNEIVFFEVKTRTNNKYGKPIDAVNQIKQKHIYKATKYYLYIKGFESEYIRLDAIEIYIKNNKYYINHIKQIV